MTAKELVKGLPSRFKPDMASGFSGNIQLVLEGEGGGEFSVQIKDGACKVEEGLIGIPDCVVRAKASVYVDTETGKLNPTMAVMMGKIKVSNIGVLTQFIQFFERL
jgi:putative sterol carrier protein